MSKKLGTLKKSLDKKEQDFQRRFDAHVASVKEANGQPLNDKRNGQVTLNRWEKQNDAIRRQLESIENTKNAIEREQDKIAGVQHANTFLPTEILELVEKGELIQWRKHPHIFFVAGVEKARIIWDEKKKHVAHKYVTSVTEKEQRSKFARVYNQLNSIFNNC